MKQIEITMYVNQTMEEIDEILKQQGFEIIRRTNLRDKYFTLRYDDLNKDNILEILNSCVLLRYIIRDGKIYKNITYKDKNYYDGLLLSEELIEVHIEEIDNMERILEKVGFKNLINVNNNMVVYGNDDIEFGIQQIEGLGILLEYENLNDFTNFSNEEIIREKERMLNEVRKYKLNVSDDYNVRKAYELIKKYNSNY